MRKTYLVAVAAVMMVCGVGAKRLEPEAQNICNIVCPMVQNGTYKFGNLGIFEATIPGLTVKAVIQSFAERENIYLTIQQINAWNGTRYKQSSFLPKGTKLWLVHLINLHSKITGTASWYGPGFFGKKTSCGTIYTGRQMTAAHMDLRKDVPCGTRIRITNLSNGKSVVVTVDDTGNFAKYDIIIDVSYAAAIALDMLIIGIAPVKLEILS